MVKSFAILQGYVVFLDNLIIDAGISTVASYKQFRNELPYLNSQYIALSQRSQRISQQVQTNGDITSENTFSYSPVEKVVFCLTIVLCVLAISVMCVYVLKKAS